MEYTRPDGSIGGALVRVIDFDHPENNDWVAVNQFTVVEGQHNRRPDVLIFLNGLPIAADRAEESGGRERHHLDCLQPDPDLQGADSLAVRLQRAARHLRWPGGAGRLADRRPPNGSCPGAPIEGEELAPASMPQLQVVMQGLLDKRRLLDFIRYFIVFEDEGGGILTKKIAGYHQFHAVNRALARDA